MDKINKYMDDKINNFVIMNKLTNNPEVFSAITDGIVNETVYWTCKYRILFLLKEPYDEIELSETEKVAYGGGWSEAMNLADENKIFENYKNKTYNRIANVVWCILNEKKKNDEQINLKQAFQMFNSIAIMNISKMPNLTLSDNSYISKCYDLWKPILLEQINLYNPDILIFGNTFSHYRNDIFNDWQVPLESVREHRPFTRNGKLYLNWYHPCYFGISNEDYINPLLDDFWQWKNNNNFAPFGA